MISKIKCKWSDIAFFIRYYGPEESILVADTNTGRFSEIDGKASWTDEDVEIFLGYITSVWRPNGIED